MTPPGVLAASTRARSNALHKLTLPQLVGGLALFVGLLLALSWLMPRPAVLDVGESDATLAGFYAPEVGPQSRFRWTGPSSQVTFPGIGAGTWQLELTFATQRPPDHPPPTVEIYSGPELVARFTPTDSDFQSYTADLPLRNGVMDEITLTINTTPTYSPSGEPRALGIAIDKIVMIPLAPVLPSLWHLLSLVLTVVVFALALDIIGGHIAASLGGISLALVLSALIAWDRLWVTPFSLYLPIISTTLAAVGLLHRTIVSRYLRASPHRAVTRRWITMLLALALLIAALVFVIQVVYAFSGPRASDLRIYLVAADRINQGGPLYDLEGLRTNQFSEWYKYPPLLAGVLRPLAILDFETARTIWRVFLLICFLAAILLVIYAFTRNPLTTHGSEPPAVERVPRMTGLTAPATLAFLALALIFRPAIDAINLGQPDTLILLLMAATLAALRVGRPLLAGVPLALAVALKLYPALLLLYLLVRREWRAVGSFAVALAGWGVLGVLFTSPSDTATYLTQVLPGTSGTSAWPANQTIAGFFARLFTDRFYRLEPFPADLELRSLLLKVITYASAALVLGITLWMSRRPAARTSMSYSLGFCLTMTAGIFVLPVAWIHYFTSLLLAFAVAFYAFQKGWPVWRLSHPSYALWSAILLVLAALLLSYENIWFLFDRANLGGLWKLSLSYKLYGELALWGGLLMLQSLANRSSPIAGN